MPPRRFNTSGDCRRYLAHLLNLAHDDKMETVKASKLAFICQILIRTLEQTALEERITRLEQALTEAKQGRPLTIVTSQRKGK